jgi:hypothetical protein
MKAIFGEDGTSIDAGTAAALLAATWDRFHKTPFRPKTFRINFHPQSLAEFVPQNSIVHIFI